MESYEKDMTILNLQKELIETRGVVLQLQKAIIDKEIEVLSNKMTKADDKAEYEESPKEGC